MKQNEKIMLIAKILMENSNEENPMTAQKLIDKLNEYGASIERKSIYSAIDSLISFIVDSAPDSAIGSGKDLFSQYCAACHGEHFEGDIGPELDGEGYEENDLFEIIYLGIADGGMPPFSSLGADKVWKLVNFIKYYNKGEDHQ